MLMVVAACRTAPLRKSSAALMSVLLEASAGGGVELVADGVDEPSTVAAAPSEVVNASTALSPVLFTAAPTSSLAIISVSAK